MARVARHEVTVNPVNNSSVGLLKIVKSVNSVKTVKGVKCLSD
jgi:hypothetical protein